MDCSALADFIFIRCRRFFAENFSSKNEAISTRCCFDSSRFNEQQPLDMEFCISFVPSGARILRNSNSLKRISKIQICLDNFCRSRRILEGLFWVAFYERCNCGRINWICYWNVCRNARKGKQIWRKNLQKNF